MASEQPDVRAQLNALIPDEADRAALWTTAWDAYYAQYNAFRDANPGWRAFFSAHHSSALDAALEALLPQIIARGIAEGLRQATEGWERKWAIDSPKFLGPRLMDSEAAARGEGERAGPRCASSPVSSARGSPPNSPSPRARRPTMAKPDDDHEPRAILGDNGEVLAVAHVSPDVSPETVAHLREVIDAVRRLDDALPIEEREARAERQRAAIARVRDRAARLRDARNAGDEAVRAGLDAALADPPRVRSGYQCVTGGDACPGHPSKWLMCDPPAGEDETPEGSDRRA